MNKISKKFPTLFILKNQTIDVEFGSEKIKEKERVIAKMGSDRIEGVLNDPFVERNFYAGNFMMIKEKVCCNNNGK